MKDLKKLIIFVLFFVGTISTQADSAVTNFLLTELNRNFDANVQTEIVKTLGSYTAQQNVQNALFNIILEPRYNSRVRAQAAYSVSKMTAEQRVLNTILRAHDRSRDLWLRAKFLEAIYPSVLNNQKVLTVLKNNLIQNHDPLVQQASAFSLGKNIEDAQIKSFLIQRSESPFLNENVRIEIIKSLYTVLRDQPVKATLQRIAMGPQNSPKIRSAATRVLATGPKTRSSRQALFDLLSLSGSIEIRQQAAAGLKFELTEDDVKWMRLVKDPRSGLLRNPFPTL
jgi:hypothetical protein